ncbi:MAG TPA: CapA family protein [Candidatus Paceibacterota bacterium]|nr:CapA family protein [Candidatus Paceibacterota bacterium]
MKRYLFALVFLSAFFAMFSFLESRTVIFRTLVSSAKTAIAPETEARLLFVGDLMFDRHIRTVMERSGGEAVLGSVTPLLKDADLTIGNLEGPVTDNLSQSQGTKVGDLTNMRFTFSPAVPKLLHDAGFDLVSIGNNHIQDFGVEGVRSTRAYLSSANISYVGDPTGASTEPVVKEVNGITVAFVAYSDFVGGDADRAMQEVAGSTADVTVVLAHWGTEYEAEPLPRVRKLAGDFAAAGADLIIGSHPHVIGAVEDIGTTRVYYSLGNFVFDQYFDQNVRCGLAVKATVRKGKSGVALAFEETKVGMRSDGATVLGCS